jgi:hypothetical protein
VHELAQRSGGGAEMIGRIARLALGASLVAGSAGAAGSFDGSKALVCSFNSVVACDSEGVCGAVEAGDMDLPGAIRVDFAGRRLRSEDGQRSSPIDAKNVSDAALIAQGSQNGRGWSMTIDRATGQMTGTIAEADGAFVLFGTCADAP